MPITVAWFSYFPLAWLPDLPPHLRTLPPQHPATWQRVLLEQLERNPEVRLHILVLQKHFLRSESFERNGVVFHLVKTLPGMRVPSLFWMDTWLVRRVLKQVKPDVVHAWGSERGAALVASRLPYANIVTMQGLLTWLATIVPLDRYHRLAALFEDRSLRRARLVTAESTFAIRYLGSRHPHLKLHQVEHSPLPLFSLVRRRPQVRPFRFLFVGAFSRLKGVDLLFLALEQLAAACEFELVVVGEAGPDQVARVKAQTSAALWQRVSFRGNLTAEQIAEELSLATLFLYPTRCDNSPNAVKEAVVAGVPVVASAIGGVVDHVIPNRNGVLFRSEDVPDFVRALNEALRHPLFRKGEVESAALEEMRARLSSETMSARFLELYRLAAGAAWAAIPKC